MKRSIAIFAAAVLASLASTPSARAGSCDGMTRGERRIQAATILDAAAMTHGLDPDLLSAIAQVESGECPSAESPKGAAGLMQLMPDTANRFGVVDVFDPMQNALGAARFIAYLRRTKPDGNLTLPEILAAYNAGEGAVARAGGIPPYEETRDYVRHVLWLYLLGYVPQSQRSPSRATTPVAHSTAPATHYRVKARHRDADADALEQLSQLRRARELEQASHAR